MKQPPKPHAGEPDLSTFHQGPGCFADLDRRLFGLAARRVRSNGAQEARDLVQEAYVRFISHCKQHGVPESPDAYIIRILINLVAERWRRQERDRSCVEVDSAIVQARLESGADTCWCPATDATGEFDDLVHTIERLPERRKAILLLDAAGYSPSEIAVELHISPHTVKKYLTETRAQLRSQIQGGLDGTPSGNGVANSSGEEP